MSSLRKERIDEVVRALQEHRGQAKFGTLFGLMSFKYGTTKESLWSYLKALKASGKIDYPESYLIQQEMDVLIKVKKD